MHVVHKSEFTNVTCEAVLIELHSLILITPHRMRVYNTRTHPPRHPDVLMDRGTGSSKSRTGPWQQRQMIREAFAWYSNLNQDVDEWQICLGP